MTGPFKVDRSRGATRHRVRCPWCGLEVLCDDVAKVIAHEEPECSDFQLAVALHGGDEGVRLEVDPGEWTKKGQS